MSSARGQSAIEYMMTYGWGILVVLVVGVILWQMGYLELGRNVTPDKRGFSQVTPIDWSMAANGTLIVVIQNNAGTIVNLMQTDTAGIVTISGNGPCTVPPESTIAFDDNFRPGSTSKLTFWSCPLSTGTKIGDYYRVNLTISYQTPASGLLHKSNGVIWGPIG